MIIASEFIKTGFSADDAAKLNVALTPCTSTGEKVCVDFSNVRNFTTLFFNQTFAKILVDIGPARYNDQFELINLSTVGKSTYQHSLENAKQYYKKTEKERNKHDTILASDLDD